MVSFNECAILATTLVCFFGVVILDSPFPKYTDAETTTTLSISFKINTNALTDIPTNGTTNAPEVTVQEVGQNSTELTKSRAPVNGTTNTKEVIVDDANENDTVLRATTSTLAMLVFVFFVVLKIYLAMKKRDTYVVQQLPLNRMRP